MYNTAIQFPDLEALTRFSSRINSLRYKIQEYKNAKIFPNMGMPIWGVNDHDLCSIPQITTWKSSSPIVTYRFGILTLGSISVSCFLFITCSLSNKKHVTLPFSTALFIHDSFVKIFFIKMHK